MNMPIHHGPDGPCYTFMTWLIIMIPIIRPLASCLLAWFKPKTVFNSRIQFSCRMLRQLTRGLPSAATVVRVTPSAATVTTSAKHQAGGPPPKIECFVDGKKVLVDPGILVQQMLKVPHGKSLWGFDLDLLLQLKSHSLLHRHHCIASRGHGRRWDSPFLLPRPSLHRWQLQVGPLTQSFSRCFFYVEKSEKVRPKAKRPMNKKNTPSHPMTMPLKRLVKNNVNYEKSNIMIVFLTIPWRTAECALWRLRRVPSRWLLALCRWWMVGRSRPTASSPGRPGREWWSSSWSTTPWIAPSVTREGSATFRTSQWPSGQTGQGESRWTISKAEIRFKHNYPTCNECQTTQSSKAFL